MKSEWKNNWGKIDGFAERGGQGYTFKVKIKMMIGLVL